MLFVRSLLYANLRTALRGRAVRFRSGPSAFLTVEEGGQNLVICRRNRLPLYKGGLNARVDGLARSYLLHRIEPDIAGDFIDCGANIGELGFFARARGLTYHAFEPEKLEADCCDLNNFQGEPKTNRLALWHEVSTLKFYSKPGSGDSSLIEMGNYNEVKEVPTTTLDRYVEEKGIKRIAVMKIEAEGAEPEILNGAAQALRIARYVTVDCGFERGKSQESTAPAVVNHLLRNGFDLVDWNKNWARFLFRRQE